MGVDHGVARCNAGSMIDSKTLRGGGTPSGRELSVLSVHHDAGARVSTRNIKYDQDPHLRGVKTRR
jgi:hypothetical protein